MRSAGWESLAPVSARYIPSAPGARAAVSANPTSGHRPMSTSGIAKRVFSVHTAAAPWTEIPAPNPMVIPSHRAMYGTRHSPTAVTSWYSFLNTSTTPCTRGGASSYGAARAIARIALTSPPEQKARGVDPSTSTALTSPLRRVGGTQALSRESMEPVISLSIALSAFGRSSVMIPSPLGSTLPLTVGPPLPGPPLTDAATENFRDSTTAAPPRRAKAPLPRARSAGGAA
mmetsp:Transcript_19327/g.61587  ORF Transcript_19327/g.61587 Transcript_19327/m.61587 type:complete len:230 (+) Transcript_19327:245-934(+)